MSAEAAEIRRWIAQATEDLLRELRIEEVRPEEDPPGPPHQIEVGFQGRSRGAARFQFKPGAGTRIAQQMWERLTGEPATMTERGEVAEILAEWVNVVMGHATETLRTAGCPIRIEPPRDLSAGQTIPDETTSGHSRRGILIDVVLEKQEKEGAMESLRVMIVDDSIVVRKALEKILQGLGCQVVFLTGDTREVAEAIDTHRPDLLFLDIIMPGPGGLAILAQIRETHSDLKVVMLTSVADAETAQEAKRLRANHYIIKPFSPEVIQRTIRKVMG